MLSIIIAIILSGCSSAADSISDVSPHEYSKQGYCWIDGGGRLSTLLAIERVGKLSIPYAISKKCDVRVEGYEAEDGFLGYPIALRLTGDKGLLRKSGLYGEELHSNFKSVSRPSYSSKIYDFVGMCKNKIVEGRAYCTIVSVEKFTDSGINLGDYLNMSKAQRDKMRLESLHQ